MWIAIPTIFLFILEISTFFPSGGFGVYAERAYSYDTCSNTADVTCKSEDEDFFSMHIT